ncbi:hypothetical protein PQX77_013979 [Marasmius sp. AFHP31]|nr:hypothetical protein PQX77_013979 [Marasmius sp. AFHP31]
MPDPSTKTLETSRRSRTTAQSSAPTTGPAAESQPLELNVFLLHPKNDDLTSVSIGRYKDYSNLKPTKPLPFRSFPLKPRSGSVNQDEFEDSLPLELTRTSRQSIDENALVNDTLNLEQCNSNLIDMIVTGYDIEDEQSSVAPLPQLVRYGKLLGSNFTPSRQAQSRNRTVSQQDASTALFDGSFVVDEQGKRTADRVAQPIEIFYPPFATVKQKLRDATLEPSPDILGLVYELMDS